MTSSRSPACPRCEKRTNWQGRALQCILAAAVIATGALALDTSELRQTVDLWADIHLLFGALLLGFVVARFHFSMTPKSLSSSSETYTRYRQMKRVLYLLLYSAIAIRQVISVVAYYSYGKAVDFDFANFHPSGHHYFGFDPQSDGHAFVACGVLALVAIRLLMFTYPSVQEASHLMPADTEIGREPPLTTLSPGST
jgi:cytochrome b561